MYVHTDLPTPRLLLLLLPIPMAPTQRPRLESMPESVSEPVAEADFGPGVAQYPDVWRCATLHYFKGKTAAASMKSALWPAVAFRLPLIEGKQHERPIETYKPRAPSVSTVNSQGSLTRHTLFSVDGVG